MAKSPELLCVGEFDESTQALIDQLRSHCGVSQPDSLLDGLRAIGNGENDILVTSLSHPLSAGALMEAGGILDQLPDGLALVDSGAKIIWHNSRFQEMSGETSILAREFFTVLEANEILGPDFGPIQSALASGESTRTTLRVGEKTYFELNAEPITPLGEEYPHLLVIVIRDVSIDVQHREKLTAIYTAGVNLSDLSPRDIADMTVDDRVELLKSQILHSTQHILGFDKIEIRLLDRDSGRLDPLLIEGMEPLAADRELFAKPTGNGVTGFVAHTCKSYLCEDIPRSPCGGHGVMHANTKRCKWSGHFSFVGGLAYGVRPPAPVGRRTLSWASSEQSFYACSNLVGTVPTSGTAVAGNASSK